MRAARAAKGGGRGPRPPGPRPPGSLRQGLAGRAQPTLIAVPFSPVPRVFFASFFCRAAASAPHARRRARPVALRPSAAVRAATAPSLRAAAVTIPTLRQPTRRMKSGLSPEGLSRRALRASAAPGFLQIFRSQPSMLRSTGDIIHPGGVRCCCNCPRCLRRVATRVRAFDCRPPTLRINGAWRCHVRNARFPRCSLKYPARAR